MTTRTKPDHDRKDQCTRAVDRSPNNKGGTIANGMSSREPMYSSRDKWIARSEMSSDESYESILSGRK